MNSNIRLKDYFKLPMLRILESNEEHDSYFSSFLGKFCIICNFCQLLSYLFGIYNLENNGTRNRPLESFSFVFYYSNSSNILRFFSNFTVFTVIYAVITFLLYLALLIQGMFFIFFQMKKKKYNFLIFRLIEIYFSWFISLHPWIFTLTFNDVFCFVFEEVSNSLIFSIITLINIGFNLYLYFFSVWANRTMKFFDNSGLRFELNTISAITFLLKWMTSIIYHFFWELKFLFYLLLHGIFILHFVNIKKFPIRNKSNCRFFFAILFAYESILICVTLWEYTGIIEESSLLYVTLMLISLSFRFGQKLFNQFYSTSIFCDLCSNRDNIIYYLEEIYDFKQYNMKEVEKIYLFLGSFFHHTKVCNDKKCKQIRETYIDANVLSLNDSEAMNKLIMQKFKFLLSSTNKNSDKLPLYLLKYVSFLIISNANPVKSFLEIQKIRNSLKLTNQTFFEEIYLEIFIKRLKKKIKSLTTDNGLGNESSKNGMTVEAFFKVLKIHSNYEKEMRELLKAKKSFWEYYQMEINSSQALMENCINLTTKIRSFHEKILPTEESEKNRSVYLIQLKYLSIFHSTLFNSLNLAYKYEDEYENLIKREMNTNVKVLQNLSFLDEKIATLTASFLTNEGRLREDSKTDKAAEFFGYSSVEFRSIKLLSSLMPKYIAQHHDDFLRRFLKKSKQELEENTRRIIDTYALDKREFIFPIRIFFGYNVDYKDDFVMIAALMKFNNNDSYEFICDERGEIVGFSEKSYHFFHEQFPLIEKQHLHYLNLRFLITELDDFIRKSNEKGTKVINFSSQSGVLCIPANLMDIVDVMRQLRDMENNNNNNNSKTGSINKSIKTINSRTTGSIFTRNREKLFSGLDQDFHKAQKRVYDELMSKNNTHNQKYSINFDFTYENHAIGTQENENLTIIHIKITSMKSKAHFLSKQETSTLNKTVFDDRSDNMISETRGPTALLPPENSTQFKQIFNRIQVDSKISLSFVEDEEKHRENTFENIHNTENVLMTNLDQNNTLKKNVTLFTDTKIEVFHNELSSYQKEELEASSKHDSESIKDFNEEKAKNARKVSGRSSSVTENRINYMIFTTISAIQNYFPGCIKKFSFILLVELSMIIVYSSVAFTFYQNYVSNTYEPTQRSLVRYCNLATSLSYATAMFTEMEYQTFNLTTRKLSPMKMKIWKKIMQQNFEWMKTTNFLERNIEGNLQYQEIFKTTEILLVDYDTLEVKKIRYTDTFDFFASLIQLTIDDFNRVLPKQEQIIPQRNYPYTLPGASVIYIAVKNDFINSNLGTTDKILSLLIAFLVANFFVKVFELLCLVKYYRIISQIIAIFRRVNLQDAIKENIFYQEAIQSFNHSILNSNLIDKRINKKPIVIDHGRESIVVSSEHAKKKVKTQNSKKFSLFNVKQLPKTKIFVFMTVIIALSFIYYFFNYYFWIANNVSINQLIQINCFFIDAYIYSTSIMGFNTLALRERVVRDLDYEKVNEFYQNHQNRLSYFYSSLIKRVYIIGNATAFYLPRYTIDAQKSINDPQFDELVYKDICLVLLNEGILDEEEIDFCRGSFHGAFETGILSLVNDYIITIKSFDDYIKVIKVDDPLYQQQIKDVKNFINSQDYEDFMFSYFYVHNAMLKYYNTVNDYYKGVLDSEMEKLYIFLILTTILTSLIFLTLCFYLKKKLLDHYKNITLSLSLIPYEKLINDEQTKFLIQNYYKKL